MHDADDQGEVIAFLSDPRSHGAGATKVERIETHASVVFLVGARALKLKRAVRFSYLDYSSLERRRQACLAELTLNRQTAPALYLGVAAVVRDPRGRLAIDGIGTAVEWLVVMRRFDRRLQFDHLAGAGGLTPESMRDLADQVAAFHRRAPPHREHGGRAAMQAVVDGNARSFAALPPGIFAPESITELRRQGQAALESVGPLLERRRNAGKVRLCHGDLHLANICLFEGRPTLFDRIEFSLEIACIDVVYDLAFLLMDLEVRGLRPHANRVLNRYLDRLDEADALPALPLFLSLRAAIRAHVGAAAFLRSGSRQAGRLAEAQRYLIAALALLHRRPACLVGIGGFSGSGKTSLAYALAPSLGSVPGARVLRSDVLRKTLAGVDPETRLPPDVYTAAATRAVYDALIAGAGALAAAGSCTIAEAVFAHAADRAALGDAARRAGVPFVGIWLDAPPSVMAARIAARRGDPSDATPAVLQRQLQEGLGPVEWIRIDAGGDGSACRAAALSLLPAASRA